MLITVSTPASRARSSVASRSALNRLLVRCACVSMSRPMARILLSVGLCVACNPEEPLPDAGCKDLPLCRQNSLLTCGPDGGIAESPCGEQRCAADAPAPLCVPVDALPCDPGDPPDECRNGRVFGCHPTAGYVLERSCEPGELCVGDGCKLPGAITCDPRTWSTLCVDGAAWRCAGGHPTPEEGACAP
jgi:hypothetical protein